MSGNFNLPVGTLCELRDNILYFNNSPICYLLSENSHKHFVWDGDEKGKIRGELINTINQKMKKNDKMVNLLIQDSICLKYRNKMYQGVWLWNDFFYSGIIEDLLHIEKLLNTKNPKIEREDFYNVCKN